MRKILVGFIEDGKAGGIDRYLLNFLNAVWEENLQIDFLTNRIDQELQKKLSKRNVRLFEIANLRHPIRQYRQVRKLIHKYQYDTVYLNISTAIDCVAAWAAKKEKVPMRILHSHTAGNDCANSLVRLVYNVLHSLCKTVLYKTGTKFYGCSRMAGIWMFPKHIVESERFQVIFNAVDTQKFQYDQSVREQIRKEMELDEHFVIGHAGNFCYQKNHSFLIRIFAEVVKKIPNAKLILAGGGSMLDEIKQQVHEMQLDKNVCFLGWRSDVEKLFQAMDVFVFPSFFEGLGFVAVEAQISGLPVIVSDKVPEEVKITENCHFVSLNESPAVWADVIVKSRLECRQEAKILSNVPEYDLKRQKKILKTILE